MRKHFEKGALAVTRSHMALSQNRSFARSVRAPSFIRESTKMECPKPSQPDRHRARDRASTPALRAIADEHAGGFVLSRMVADQRVSR